MTTNLQLQQMADTLKIPNFRGVICRNEFKSLLPSQENECGIYNFQGSSEKGSHWVAWVKREKNWYNFCSFGSSPVNELREYSGNSEIMYSDYKIQNFEEKTCGEYCILFLYLFSYLSSSSEKSSRNDQDYMNVVLFINDLSNAF